MPGVDALAHPAALGRWWSEHSLLDALVEDLRRALEARQLEAARGAADALSDALFAHFSLEEDVYFPLLLRASPDHGAAVHGARLGHARIRERLEELCASLDQGGLEPARRALALLLDLFHRHEDEESEMVARLASLVQA
jgi:hypothetical protein